MEFHNNNQGYYFLSIQVEKDLELTKLNYEIDGKKNNIFLSNQGDYAIYLDHFSSLWIEEHKEVHMTLLKWNVKYENAIKQYQNALLKTETNCIYTIRSLYDKLPTEPTERLYHIFKRLLALTIEAVKKKDQTLKKFIHEELNQLIQTQYSGTQNYVGNWWVFEIGIPRCLNEMLILLYFDLPKEVIFTYLSIENFYLPQAEYEYYRRDYPNIHRIKTNYANLADTIYICLLRNILFQNEKEIKHLYSLLPSLLKITESKNGFYLDGSFVYHDCIPYNASYGEVLLHSITKILELYSFLEVDCSSYYESLYTIIEKSYIPFLYHQRALDCVRGRAISRTKGAMYSFETILNSFHRLAKLFAKQGFLDYIFNEEMIFYYTPKVYAFNAMDRYIKRNQDYLIAISAYSKFISNYESINGENLLGSYQSNFTFDLYYNQNPTVNEVLKVHPFYRNGSTNILELENPNETMENQITAGVTQKNLLNTCFHQKNTVEGYFSKFVLENSMVAVGTNIHSLKEYVSTIYNFEEDYLFHKNKIETETFKIIVEEAPLIEKFKEERSFHDLNLNEEDVKKTFSVTRAYYKNPKRYVYQLYPKAKCIEDSYQLYTLENAHIIKYKTYYMINLFTKDKVIFEDMQFQGPACMIIEQTENEYIVKVATDSKTPIYIQIKGYENEQNLFQFDDEFEHTIHFRRST